MLPTLLLLLALGLLVAAAFGVNAGRINLLAAGLACWAASLLVAHLL